MIRSATLVCPPSDPPFSLDIVPQTGTFIANQWMLTGRKMSAAQALQLNIISQVCKEEELDAVTKNYCAELLTSYDLVLQS